MNMRFTCRAIGFARTANGGMIVARMSDDTSYIHLAISALKDWQKEHPGEHCDVHVWLDGDEYKVEIIPRQ